MKVFMIKNTETNKFLSNIFNNSFSDIEQALKYKNEKSAKKGISNIVRRMNNPRYSSFSTYNKIDISKLEISEVEISYNVVNTIDTTKHVDDTLLAVKIMQAAKNLTYYQENVLSQFLDKMISRNNLSKISYIFILNRTGWANPKEEIKDSKQRLKQLQIKTRQFYESNGVLAMVNKDQALKSKLVLNPACSIDVDSIRGK